MTAEDFQNKYGVKDEDAASLAEVLDKLYLEYTKEQALAMVEDYLDHADEIYNSKLNK